MQKVLVPFQSCIFIHPVVYFSALAWLNTVDVHAGDSIPLPTWTESIRVQKWYDPQGGRDAAAWYQMAAGGLQLSSFCFQLNCLLY